ncbi:MAG: hypothetical protein LBP56_10450 [Odoribacteraceae bacterium]|nr:hypothetical protein [Odoribacteraceae bacterium]
MEDRIIRQVSQMEKPRRAGMVRFLRPFMGWAALLVIVVLAARWATGVPSQEMNITDPQLDADFNPTTEEILEYLTQEVNLAVLSNEILEE